MEEWREFDKHIDVSNLGRVRKRVIRYNKDGVAETDYDYNRAKMTCNGYKMFSSVGKVIYVHHAVADLFIGTRPAGLVIDHIDRDKSNNHVSNLRYCTYQDNSRNTDRYITSCPIDDMSKRKQTFSYEKRLNERFKSVIAIKYTDEYTIFECTNGEHNTYIIKRYGVIKRANKEFSTFQSASLYASYL